MERSDFYTLAEAAEVLGVHYETAARWARSGKLESVKISRKKVLIPVRNCRRLLRSSRPDTLANPHGNDPWAGLVGQTSAEQDEQLRQIKAEMDELPFGHPAKWLKLAGMITDEEGDQIMAAVEEAFEVVEDD